MTTYIAYFDSLGFEFIYNLTNDSHEHLLDILGDRRPKSRNIPRYAILRAQANPQRFPEIWAFDSDIDQDTLEDLAAESPQMLADLIRKHGEPIFQTPKQKLVIV
jgi:hypothetical protein